MKIAIMTAWNTDEGASIHAYRLVNEWLKKGHKVIVFSFIKDDYEPYQFVAKDERYVIRCFGRKRKYRSSFIDPRPILTVDFDIFVVENLRMLPVKELVEIFPLISKRARTVNIIHEDKLPKETWFYQFIWDKVIYYDERQEFIKDVYPDAEFIPFPCFKVRKGDKKISREKFNLPQDKKIIFVFCQRGYEPYLRDLPEELKNEAVVLFLIYPGYEMLEKETPPAWMIIKEENAVSLDKLDEYLFASDAAIFHKFQSRYHNIVSSIIFQVIGTDCPIFVPEQSPFFHPLKEEVVYYNDMEELHNKLVNIFINKNTTKKVIESAEVFVQMNSAEKIADIYIDLFTKILRKRGE